MLGTVADFGDAVKDIAARSFGMDEDGDFSVLGLLGGLIGVGAIAGVLSVANRKVGKKVPLADRFAEAWLWMASGEFIEDMTPDRIRTFNMGLVNRYKKPGSLSKAAKSEDGKEIMRRYNKARKNRGTR